MNRKSFVAMLSVGTILTVVASLCITVNAEEKTNNSSAQNAVVVPQDAETPAYKFFRNMSPEEFRNPVAMDDFISRFPDSPEARAVFAIRFSLLEKFPTIEGYNDFIDKYPDKLQTQIAIQEVFKLYCNQNRVSGYCDFIKRHPNTEQALVATLYIQEIMFQYACQLDTVEEYDAFIEAFPDAPQVKAARIKATQKAIEIEKKNREKFEGNFNEKDEREKELAKSLNSRITLWQTKRPNKLFNNDTKLSKDNNETEISSPEEWLKAYKWYREAEVYQKVYPGIGNIGQIQETLDRYEIKTELGKIEKLIKENNDKLINELNKISDNISKQLSKIANNQGAILEKLDKCFNDLHEDLKVIHEDLRVINHSIKDANAQLKKLNNKLDVITSLIQVAITSNPLPMLNVYLENIKNFTDSFEPDVDIEGDEFDFVEYRRKQASIPMNKIALCGFNSIDENLFINTKVGSIINDMLEKWRSFTASNTTIGKFLGIIVEKTTKFVPVIGPYIAPMAGEATEYYVDEVFVPYINQLTDDLKNNAELCMKILNQYKDHLLIAVEELAKEKLSPEAIEKIKDFITKFNVEDAKTFIELVKQVAQKLIDKTAEQLSDSELVHYTKDLLYRIYYVN